MLSVTKIKDLKKLRQKKYRKQFGQFIVEGEKMVRELAEQQIKASVFVTSKDLLSEFSAYTSFLSVEHISLQTMQKISQFEHPSPAFAVVNMHDIPVLNPLDLPFPLLALDFIQDPGNLGTIIRTADWFGFKGIVCSPDTVDRFNHKVVQSSMGAIFRMPVLYTDLFDLFHELTIPVFGMFLDGQNIYTTSLPRKAIYLIGNESNGISTHTEQMVSKRLTIPNFSKQSYKTESLNAAVSAAIVCSEVSRQTFIL